mmetsp:Transcript_49605/g.156138  ORF Transcript_49605/g.156138 Transcript_49605/m.156138 type:complete len:247 (-) Transcript_49605:2-742(-)
MSNCAAGQSPAATEAGSHGAMHFPNMLPMQLPRMSGSFMPRKSVAISAGLVLPVESKKSLAPAGRTNFSSTTPAPHISGMKRKSEVRCSTPLSTFCGARFQFQYVALLKLLLPFMPSMSRCASGVATPAGEIPGMRPTRPQPHIGSSAARAAFSSVARSEPPPTRAGRKWREWLPVRSPRRAVTRRAASTDSLKSRHREPRSRASSLSCAELSQMPNACSSSDSSCSCGLENLIAPRVAKEGRPHT